MNFILNLIEQSVVEVWLSLTHNWPYLLASVVVAVLLKRYLNASRVSAFLNRHRGAGVSTATAAAVATPLCSCGTTAVVLGMMATAMPWAPIVAFMVASPLTSPEGLVYNAGLFGWPFSIAFFVASILLGLAGGWLAAILERYGWLANQTRFSGPVTEPAGCSCSEARAKELTPQGFSGLLPASSPAGCGCGELQPVMLSCCEAAAPVQACTCSGPGEKPAALVKPDMGIAWFLKEAFNSGKTLLLLFLAFAFIGFFLNGLIPASWISAVFGSGHAYSVPLAATLGLPLYINTEASMPLIRALIDNGMSQGSALAFIIAGAGTSIGAIAGALTIARWRVVALVVAVLWAGAILSGFAYNLLLALRLF
jgi:uncharacterized membrane protein YraQ (UPF0718 family)